MLKNNLILKAECRYFDITFDGKEWVAWFYKIADESPKLIRKGGE